METPSPAPTPITSSNSTTWVPPANGIVGGYTGANVNINRAMMAFAAIAWYNSVELIFLILFRFKRYTGLYFWSMMITTLATIVYMIGAWGKMVNIAAQTLITQTFCNIGWICMVGGNSLVLYSRLHLITQNFRLLRWILCIIIANAILMYIPTTALDYGCNVNPWSPGYCNGYSVMERIQMTVFSIQEFAISGLYLVEAYRYLKTSYRADLKTKHVMYELVAVNIALIVLDVALLSVEYEDLYQIEVTLKGTVYSLKLKLELYVLSRLVKIVAGGHSLNRTSMFTGLPWNDKHGPADVDSDHIEDKDSAVSPSQPRSSSTVPWLSRVSTNRSQRENQVGTTRQSPQQQPSLDFLTEATNVDKAEPTFENSRGVRLPPHSSPAENITLTVPSRVATRRQEGSEVEEEEEAGLSRASSISVRYPGRITGG